MAAPSVHSPSGFRHPGLHEYEGEGGLAWLRSFSGLLVTCGLDHILFMHEDTAAHYHYVHRQSVKSSIHGRISTIPGKLIGYGEQWAGDECTLWCEGQVQQATVSGEDLHLIRRIEAAVGGSEIVPKDRVFNHGFCRTPHMYCYHINIGHPILSEGSHYLAPIAETVWAAHAGENYRKQKTGYRRLPGPKHSFHEQVWQHEMKADAKGLVPTAIINDQLGFGVLVETNKAEFPAQFEWQNFQAGLYAIGIEPSTNHAFGKPFAQQRGELIWLEHGEERSYTTRFEILAGSGAIAAARHRIAAIAAQPEDDFPEPNGSFAAIAKRS